MWLYVLMFILFIPLMITIFASIVCINQNNNKFKLSNKTHTDLMTKKLANEEAIGLVCFTGFISCMSICVIVVLFNWKISLVLLILGFIFPMFLPESQKYEYGNGSAPRWEY